jgi:uncharacterized membrane protein
MNIIGPILGGLLFLIVIVYIIIRLYVRAQLAGISRPSRRSRDEGLSKSAAIVIALLVAIIIGLAVLFFYFG